MLDHTLIYNFYTHERTYHNNYLDRLLKRNLLKYFAQ